MSVPYVALCLPLALCLLSACLAQDDGYHAYPSVPGSRYKLNFPTLHTWATALDLCQRDGGDATLAVINSEAEAEVVGQMIRQTLLPNGFYDAWVGINDIETEGTWVTVHGSLVSESGYNKWSIASPRNSTQFNCGMAYYDGLYQDWPCISSRPSICEKPSV